MELLNYNNQTLSIQQISEYLTLNELRYKEIQKPYECTTRTLPCMCFVRDKECLFIEVFQKISEKYNHFLDEKYLENELKNFDKIKTDSEKVKIWLTKNIEFGLSKFDSFSSKQNENLRLSFINGKKENEFDFLKFEICGEAFKNNYFFANLFCDLFFEQKLLPNELVKWRQQNKINEF